MTPDVSPGTCIKVCALLLVLVALTAGAAFVKMGPLNAAVAVAIAVAKALLIIWFFMQIKVSGRTIRLAAATGFVWLLILFSLSLGDYVTRGLVHIPGK